MLHIVSMGTQESLEYFLRCDAFRLQADRNAFINREVNGMTPLLCAIKQRDAGKSRLLLQAGANPLSPDKIGRTPLHVAAAEGGAEVMRALLNHCGQQAVGFRDFKFHGTPLHDAASAGQEDVITVLLEAGADIDDQTSNGETPLHRAILCQRPAAVNLLANRGANVFILRSDGVRPIDLYDQNPVLRSQVAEAFEQAVCRVPSLQTLARRAVRLYCRRGDIDLNTLTPELVQSLRLQ